MSFPGRPPMTMPGMPMPPGMLPPPPPYGMPGLPGMMPMPPGLAMIPPPLMAPVTVVSTSATISKKPTVISSAPVVIKKPPTSHPSIVASASAELISRPKFGGPSITVFVGNISDRGSDLLIRQILQKCGSVNSWKRVQGANGKLQAFGFCEYADPDSALSAIRLLHDSGLGDKRLVVKCDAKTNAVLDEYKEHKKKNSNNETQEKEDQVIRDSIQSLIKECMIDMPKDSESLLPAVRTIVEPLGGQSKHNNPNLHDIEVDDEKKDLIHREIGKFREFCQKDAETKDRQKEFGRDRKDRNFDRDRRDREVHSPREVERPRHDMYRRSRSRSVEKERERNRDNHSYHDREKDRERGGMDKGKDSDEEEEEKERRRMERKLREKEVSYQERLKNWEAREKKKVRDYEKEKERDDDKKREEAKEGRRLKEFLEDYDDERDDPKYYKSSALSRRVKDRDREIEADNRDRQKEKEEIDELRRRLTDEGCSDPAAEVRRRQKEEEERIREKLKKFDDEKDSRRSTKPVKRKRLTPSPQSSGHDIVDSPLPHSSIPKTTTIVPNPNPPIEGIEFNTNSASGFSDVTTPPVDEKTKPLGFTGLKIGNSPTQNNSSTIESEKAAAAADKSLKKKKIALGDVFNSQDEDASESGNKKRKLVPLEYTEEEMKAVNQQSPSSPSNATEERRKNIKNLIEKIPTAKEELFEFSIDRSLVDNVLMEKRIKPWVNKKIIEYIGEEEPTLVEFICSKVMAGSSPKSILDDVSMVLDDEAEVFVVKMWRLLIYEIEAKKLGIGK